MIRYTLAVLWLFFAGTPVAAQVQDAVIHFDEGNKLYRDGQYDEAIKSYERARSAGYTSGLLNYNLGNAYYRSDQLGQAIRFYEKARVYMPANPELLHNLEFARSQTRDQFSQLPVPAWVVWWRSLVANNGATMLFYFGLLFYLLAIGLIAHHILKRTNNPWYRRARSILVVLSILVLGAAFFASAQTGSYDQAVVVVEKVQLLEDPSETSTILLEIHEGILLDLVEQQAEWAEVQLPNGTRGWVIVSALAEV